MNEDNTNLTKTRARDQATGRKLAFSVWVFTKRMFALGAAAVTVYVAVGCALFGEWWYEFLWGDNFNWHYVAEGLKFLLDEYFRIVIIIVVAVSGAFVLGYLFKRWLFRFVDRFAGPILFASAVLSVTVALVTYNIEKPQHDLLEADKLFVRIADISQKALAASNSPCSAPQ